MVERTDLPEFHAAGLLFIGDPHLAATPPGQRQEGYLEQVLDKVDAALAEAMRRDLVPVFLGDTFHWPRENPNSLLVRLIGFFGNWSSRYRKPWLLVGNHDKYQARFTPDVSLAVLDAAGVIQLMDSQGAQFLLHCQGDTVLLGASPDFTPIPDSWERGAADTVIWITHHNLGFPDFMDKHLRIKEIPGVDWVVNGHLHRPQPTQRKGRTRWVNPGGLVRMQFTRYNSQRRPAVAIWTPQCSDDLERFELPILPFEQVFPDQELPDDVNGQVERESLFVQGLKRLAMRRTREGLGLKQFLEQNLDSAAPESPLIWQLYQEVIDGRQET